MIKKQDFPLAHRHWMTGGFHRLLFTNKRARLSSSPSIRARIGRIFQRIANDLIVGQFPRDRALAATVMMYNRKFNLIFKEPQIHLAGGAARIKLIKHQLQRLLHALVRLHFVIILRGHVITIGD